MLLAVNANSPFKDLCKCSRFRYWLVKGSLSDKAVCWNQPKFSFKVQFVKNPNSSNTDSMMENYPTYDPKAQVFHELGMRLVN